MEYKRAKSITSGSIGRILPSFYPIKIMLLFDDARVSPG